MSRNRGRYYVRKRRQADQVISEYVGAGPLAEQAAAQDAAERLRRQAAVAARQAANARAEAVDAALDEFSAALDCLFRATLLAAGYHQHDRGEWRKHHETKKDQEKTHRSRS